MHGTGHGVGFFLNVHEPPQGFTAGMSSRGNTRFKKGMLTSNEPGYYKEGGYGIRIENLVLTVHSEYPGFLKFKTMTYFPIDTTLIDISQLRETEIDWLNNYHEQVYTALAPSLKSEEESWLREKCKKI